MASISGSVGVAKAVVHYMGQASGSVIADGSGNYTIPDLANGNYVLAPVFEGYVFTPAAQSKTIAGSNIVGVSFVGIYSVPDDRDYAHFPNEAVNLQGTLQYTVPSVDSRKYGAPIDSRKVGAPVDSRINKPQNSRS
jgi:hypothetical protein